MFIEETPPVIPNPRRIDGAIYFCSLCNPLRIRYQREVNLIIEDTLLDLQIVQYVFIDLFALDGVVVGQTILDEYYASNPIYNVVPPTFIESPGPCDSLLDELKEQVIFYNDVYYQQLDYTRFASEKFCDRVEIYLNDVQDAYDTIANVYSAINGVQLQVWLF